RTMGPHAGCFLNTPQPRALCARLGAVVSGALLSAVPGAPSDLYADCEGEALLFAWLLRPRLAALDERVRCAYCARSVARELHRMLQRELRHQRGRVWLPDLAASPVTGLNPPVAAYPSRPLPHLIEEISQPDLLRVFQGLGARQRVILDLYYAQRCSDVEIARRLGTTRASVTKMRRRALAQLRNGLLHPTPQPRPSTAIHRH
ncbi:MAG: sigma-70 family RNA polymerase sigma factor, partial [Armatimonadota bacterium]|nr:sigma-70 family RNA polymerase sigma factor [Armatimonadota bacterium]